ncbi:MAG: efflux RND transporter periplasmic adaptor subunit [Deltaproteobacteria bacterium]|nr:efflux RND transporter periplasmic adaptor subunit [Deltaproteobacteria bacterium]MBW2154626.1 efflux RND transporter periplasmic adaptor subunit [Deltaproteobacteria bacterium]
MPVDRPTFSESWYRVAGLKPRLLNAVKVHRQYFRGRKWYVLQNPVNNQFFRLSNAAYHFVAMLNGRRTVSQAWRMCMEKFADAAPTQGEVIHILGQLYTSNLLQGDFTIDAGELFQRYHRRLRREVTGWFMNILSIRIPLLDPDRTLDLWVGVVGRVFTWYGFLIWAGIIGAGLWSVAGRIDELSNRSTVILNPNNLPLLYMGLVIVKVFHEMGHAFACKHFGKQTGSGGEVHEMGVTFLIFTPLPFVDASSAWALRNKWHRVVVGASGMLVELAVASVAAILWSQAAEGTTIHAIAYNIMFVAGVSTVIFNGNPLLRYDAYYILLDILEIPNLYSRSRAYLHYLVKRYVWGMAKAPDPSHTKGEKAWFTFYAIASMICRVIVLTAVFLFIGNRLFIAGLFFLIFIIAVRVLVPFGKLIRYFATNRELERVRWRAVLTTTGAAIILFVCLGLVRAPDRCRIEGVLEPMKMAVIHAKTAGFVRSFLPSGTKTTPDGPPLIQTWNPELEAQRARLLAEMRQLQIRLQAAQTGEAANAQIINEKIIALKEQIERTDQDLRGLVLTSPISGTWIAPDIDRMNGAYARRGKRIGIVADLNHMRIRAVAGQRVAARLVREAHKIVKIRVKGRPDIQLEGRIETIIPAGTEQLPSAALGYAAGGSTQIDPEDPSGRRAVEPFFEIWVIPSIEGRKIFLPGQTVVLQFDTSAKPVIVQLWRTLLQVFQRRFRI